MRRTESRRAQRLEDIIMQELGHILLQEVKDPRLELVSISGVRLNKDLSVAEVLYTHRSDTAKRVEVQDALDSASGFLRTQIGQRLRLKYIPELRFYWDQYLEDMIYEIPPTRDTNSN